jgi:hypothetical protein
MDYTRQLEDAQEQLLRLEQGKRDIERQMRGLSLVIEGLRLLGERPTFGTAPTTDVASVDPETPSLPNKVLAALADVGTPIGATQIRDRLITSRAVDASIKNLLINIHTTLKRLIKAGQVEEVPVNDGSKLYRFVTPMERAIKAPYGASNSLANMMRAQLQTEQVIPSPTTKGEK